MNRAMTKTLTYTRMIKCEEAVIREGERRDLRE